MSSRGKKKQPDNVVKFCTNAIKQNDKISAEKKKLDLYFNTILVLLLLILVVFVLFTPLVKVHMEIDLKSIYETQTSESSSEVENYVCDSSASALDMFIAPLRGVTSAIKYIAEDMDIKFKTDKSYQMFYAVVCELFGEEYVETLDTITIVIFIMSMIVLATYIVLVVLSSVARSKHKTKYKSILIVSSIFAVEVLILFVSIFIMYSKSESSQSTINLGWGLWILGLLTALLESSCIVYAVKYPKLKILESEKKDRGAK